AHRDGSAQFGRRSTMTTQPAEQNGQRESEFPTLLEIEENRRVRGERPFFRRGDDREQQDTRAPRRHAGGGVQILRAIAEDVFVNDGCVLNQRRQIRRQSDDADDAEEKKPAPPFANEKEKRRQRDNSGQFDPQTHADRNSGGNQLLFSEQPNGQQKEKSDGAIGVAMIGRENDRERIEPATGGRDEAPRARR